MKTVTFTKVEIKKIQRDRKGGSAWFSSALTNPVRSACGIGEPNPDMLSQKPGGSLSGKTMTLRNAKGELAKWDVQVDINSISDFEIIRHEMEGKRGKGYRLSLEFRAKFVDIKGCAVLEEYMVVAIDSKGTLEVSYTPASEQVEIPDVQATDEQRQATLDIETESEDDEDEDDEDDDDEEDDE